MRLQALKLFGGAAKHGQLIHAVVDDRRWRYAIREKLERHRRVEPDDGLVNAVCSRKVGEQTIEYLVAAHLRTQVGRHDVHVCLRTDYRRERGFARITYRLLHKEY